MNKDPKKKCTPCERARLARIAARKALEDKNKSNSNLKKEIKVEKPKNIKVEKAQDIIPCEECDEVKD